MKQRDFYALGYSFVERIFEGCLQAYARELDSRSRAEYGVPGDRRMQFKYLLIIRRKRFCLPNLSERHTLRPQLVLFRRSRTTSGEGGRDSSMSDAAISRLIYEGCLAHFPTLDQ